PYNNTEKNQAASPYNGKLDALTDLYQMHWSNCKVWTSYYSGTFSSKEDPLLSFTNDYVWETVHLVSLIKENIDRVPNMTDKRKRYIVAQAKALQAFAYSLLLPHYGGLPIIENTISDAGNGVGERATFEETVNAIVRWCDEAKDDLYWAYNGNDAESSSLQTGRWTKAGVMALKAQVLWLAASPHYNTNTPYMSEASDAITNNLVWYGNYDQNRWKRALDAFEDFWRENELNGNYYHLYQATAKTLDGYRLAYRRGYMFDDSPENIHWTKVAGIYGTQGAYSWLNWNTWSVNRSNNHPTLEYIEMFPWSDGKPFNRATDMKSAGTSTGKDGSVWEVLTCLSGTYDKLFYTYTPVRGGFRKTFSRDPRLYENATVSGTLENLALQSPDGVAAGNIMELWVGGQNAGQCVKHPTDNTLVESLTSYCPTGFAAYKYVLNQIEWHRDPN
ncbi:MAG: RagB/SusD family nutrient uptake outer membrane protein, partial [Muribaculaceae bacterium]|nr:RagB/SusD family nutrient uptake outer membrane protein [Muribaculaceae bacterium]